MYIGRIIGSGGYLMENETTIFKHYALKFESIKALKQHAWRVFKINKNDLIIEII